LRIPSSLNSKYNTEVTIIHQWNGYRPSITLLIGDFYAYLVDKRQRELRNTNHSRNNIHSNMNTIPWIEQLLEISIKDGRKYTLWKILCPYLVNIKKLEYEQTFSILKDWLEKCNTLKKLDFNPETEIKAKLKNVKYYNPISIKKLKYDNKNLYLLLRQKVTDIK